MAGRHKGDTKTFPQLDPSGQAKSISGTIRSLEMAIEHHVKNSSDSKAMSDKCQGQVGRLLKRLQTKYP